MNECEEFHCCICGKKVEGEDAAPSPDPFDEEINGDDTPVVECSDCRYQSAMDI